MSSEWVTNNISPTINAIASFADNFFGYTAFSALLIGVLGLSVAGLVIGLIKR